MTVTGPFWVLRIMCTPLPSGVGQYLISADDLGQRRACLDVQFGQYGLDVSGGIAVRQSDEFGTVMAVVIHHVFFHRIPAPVHVPGRVRPLRPQSERWLPAPWVNHFLPAACAAGCWLMARMSSISPAGAGTATARSSFVLKQLCLCGGLLEFGRGLTGTLKLRIRAAGLGSQ